MVVSANLKASFNNRYIRSSGGRMRILVSRLLAHIHESRRGLEAATCCCCRRR